MFFSFFFFYLFILFYLFIIFYRDPQLCIDIYIPILHLKLKYIRLCMWASDSGVYLGFIYPIHDFKIYLLF